MQFMAEIENIVHDHHIIKSFNNVCPHDRKGDHYILTGERYSQEVLLVVTNTLLEALL